MPNLATLFKEEIVRLARKELKAAIAPLRKISAQQRGAIASLKREVAQLQKRVKLAERGTRRTPEAAPPGGALRFSPARLAAHRKKLEFSAAQYGQLVGVTSQTIYNWEGGARPRQEQLKALAAVRGLGKRAALARLA